MVANVDNPLTGEIVIRGQAIENNELVASLSSLADYDGIASTAFRWEASTDGRTWDSINLPANSPTILGRPVQTIFQVFILAFQLAIVWTKKK